MTCPVWLRDELGVGAREARPRRCARRRLAVSTRWAPEVRIRTGSPLGVEEQAVGDGADLAPQCGRGECRSVGRVGQDDHVTRAAAPGELASK